LLEKVDANVVVAHNKDDDEGFVVVDGLKGLSFKDLNLPFSFNFSVAGQC